MALAQPRALQRSSQAPPNPCKSPRMRPRQVAASQASEVPGPAEGRAALPLSVPAGQGHGHTVPWLYAMAGGGARAHCHARAAEGLSWCACL
mmetsp:Transcript_100646/g.285187  ORF Transcript_100646/g.285187 Transcript_100646/m.285187 type:complete len:92 (+) Transcript_100646:266-541(+)